ncbi:MAG: pseudouridine synthase [Acidobacteriota bacterium]
MERTAGPLRGGILLFHKPKGVVVTTRDERGRRTVFDLLPPWVREEGYVPVGRLDRDSRGLLLFVKDRRLVEELGAPGRHGKTYEVWVRGRVTAEHLEDARRGVESPVGLLRVRSAEVLKTAGPKTLLRVVLGEGRNRHIRRLFGALRDPLHGTPLKVMDLKRTGFGPLSLDLPSGAWRFLRREEAERLGVPPAGGPSRGAGG